MSNTVEIKLLKDGSGRVRIHWFMHDKKGPIKTGTSTTLTALGPLVLGGAMGRIACQPTLDDVTPQFVNGAFHPCVHSDDVRAVTCPECSATKEFKEMQIRLREILEPTNPDVQIHKMALGLE